MELDTIAKLWQTHAQNELTSSSTDLTLLCVAVLRTFPLHQQGEHPVKIKMNSSLSGKKDINAKNYWKEKRRLCVKLFEVTNTTWENLQIAMHKSVLSPTTLPSPTVWFEGSVVGDISLRTLYWFVLCNLQIFSGCICHVHLEQLHAQSPFLFPIVFGIILISFLDICSAFPVLSPQLFAYAALLGPLRGQISCRLWLWQLGFGVLLRDATSNLPYSGSPRPNALSSRSVLHDGRKHKTVVFSHALRWYARRTNLPLLATGCRRC